LEVRDRRGWSVRHAWSSQVLTVPSCPLVTARGTGLWHGDGTFDLVTGGEMLRRRTGADLLWQPWFIDEGVCDDSSDRL